MGIFQQSDDFQMKPVNSVSVRTQSDWHIDPDEKGGYITQGVNSDCKRRKFQAYNSGEWEVSFSGSSGTELTQQSSDSSYVPDSQKLKSTRNRS